jgi:hypothetical protein
LHASDLERSAFERIKYAKEMPAGNKNDGEAWVMPPLSLSLCCTKSERRILAAPAGLLPAQRIV